MLTKLQKIRNQKSSEQGFTIIEVMIVLAIAGLILLIVFLAVPALQRSSRNTQRKNDAALVAASVSEYVSNHNGRSPAAWSDLGTINSSIITMPAAATAIGPRPGGSPAAPAADAIVVYTTASCSADGVTTQAATSVRSMAVWFGTEGNTTSQCINAGN